MISHELFEFWIAAGDYDVFKDCRPDVIGAPCAPVVSCWPGGIGADRRIETLDGAGDGSVGTTVDCVVGTAVGTVVGGFIVVGSRLRNEATSA